MLLHTAGAMSRFQSVTLVHAVLRNSGVRRSPSPEMKWEGREVEICRNWSVKMRGATVVFSLRRERETAATAGREALSWGHPCWAGTRLLITAGNKTKFWLCSGIPGSLPSHGTAEGVKVKPAQPPHCCHQCPR